MGKETKIGLAVIGVLLTVFSFVLYQRVRATADPAVAESDQGDQTAEAAVKLAAGKKLSSGPDKPTVLAAAETRQSAATAGDEARRPWSRTSGGRYAANESSDEGDPRGSFMAAASSKGRYDRSDEATTSDAASDDPPSDAADAASTDVAVEAAATNGDEEIGDDAGEAPVANDPFRRRPAYAATDNDADDSQSQPATDNRLSRTRPPPARTLVLEPETDADATADESADDADSDANPIRRAPSFTARTADARELTTSQYPIARTAAPVPSSNAFRSNDRVTIPAEPRALRSSLAGVNAAPAQTAGRTQSSFASRNTAAAPRALPAERGDLKADEYAVQPNDSYWIISERVYGTGAYFKAIYEHNRRQHPNADTLTVGDILSVPAEADLQRLYPDLSPKPRSQAAQQRMIAASSHARATGRTYVVEEGDTLFEIARHELGKPARWGEIYDLNRELLGADFDYLRPGLELILPADGTERSSPVTRRPGATLRR